MILGQIQADNAYQMWVGIASIVVMGIVNLVANIPGFLKSLEAAREAKVAKEAAAKAALDSAAAARSSLENQRKIDETAKKVDRVGLQIDGRLSQLLEESKKSERAEGHIEGTDQERERWSASTGYTAAGAQARQMIEDARIVAEKLKADAADDAENVKIAAALEAKRLLEEAKKVHDQAVTIPAAPMPPISAAVAAAVASIATGTADDPIHMKISAEEKGQS